ncbi:MAG: FkbM family methyltransferase [Rhodospirillaceae bacterium]|nr:MAG: FkbM family methyltransferase [Rhodospirillaceae bacterium]
MRTRHKIALARAAQAVVMLLRKVAGYDAQADVTRRSIRWHLDLREGIDFAIYLLGAFEPATLAAYTHLISPDDVVLDIGANIGAHTLHFARAVGPGGKVIAFEPTQFAYRKLCANLALNPDLASRVDARQVMLLDCADNVPAAIYASWPLGAEPGAHETHLGQLMSTEGARGLPLDQIVDALNLARVDFIKLDVDGFECHVLRGAARTLARFHPVIIMEIAPQILEEQGESLERLIALLTSYGYALRSLASDVPIAMDAAVLNRMVPSGASLNVMARVTSG